MQQRRLLRASLALCLRILYMREQREGVRILLEDGVGVLDAGGKGISLSLTCVSLLTVLWGDGVEGGECSRGDWCVGVVCSIDFSRCVVGVSVGVLRSGRREIWVLLTNDELWV